MTPALLGEIIWAIGVVAWFVIRYPFVRRAGRIAILRREGSTREKALLALSAVGLFFIPVLYIATGWPSAADYNLSYASVVIGALVFAGSLWLFRRSHKDLGRQWSAALEIRESHQIVRSGVYSRIRHPMYTSFWLWALAQAFLLPNAVAALSGLVAIAVMYFARVAHEERMMIEFFGEDYRRYMTETKRIIPGIY